jgi:hypothetical protein
MSPTIVACVRTDWWTTVEVFPSFEDAVRSVRRLGFAGGGAPIDPEPGVRQAWVTQTHDPAAFAARIGATLL